MINEYDIQWVGVGEWVIWCVGECVNECVGECVDECEGEGVGG